jgi:membrane-associated phospholipid phosphatase
VDGVHWHGGRDILSRAVAPAIALGALIVSAGWLLTPPGVAINTSEDAVSLKLEAARTDRWNYLTLVWSHLGSTGLIIGVCIVVAALVLIGTKNWRLAAVPLVAIGLQAAIFVLSAAIVDRPRPPVVKLDVSPPTASYPSGHVGASTALYTSFCLLAVHIRRVWLRSVAISVCLIVPLLVAFARLYRGMHHITDIGAAILNGITCAVLAHWWFRTSEQRPNAAESPDPAGDSGPTA